MAESRTLARVAGGCLAAGLVFLASGLTDAQAARNKKRKSGALTVTNINVANASGVAGNQIIEVEFNQGVKRSSINHAVFQVWEQNQTNGGFTRQIFGDFQIAGRVVRFYPRLPTNLRNPADPGGGFFPEGSDADDAAENAGLKPNRSYQITILGRPFVSPVLSTRNRPLKRQFQTTFSTADAGDASRQYTTTTYGDVPPPQYSFSNPPDQVPGVEDQYTHIGGAHDVPNDISVSLFCTRVPLSPATLRVLGNVNLTMLSRKGDTSLRRPIEGSVFVEQNFATTLLVAQPTFPLADLGTYSLRIKKDVKDLTEEYDFAPNRGRDHVRTIYDSLAKARANAPGTPVELLPGPSADIAPEWPSPVDENGEPDAAAIAARGVLKVNVLDLGDTYPDEIDPRVMVIFSTRDEPVTNASLRVEFLKSDEYFDPKISTAEWDATVPGAASAILTIAGGSAADGDFIPTSNVTLDSKNYSGGVMNFRDVVIPAGIKVTLVGTRPIQMRAINFTLDGTLDLTGKAGEKGDQVIYSSPSLVDHAEGGKGGPGGGKGGSAGTGHTMVSGVAPVGNPGGRGTDSNGVDNSPEGGSGGLGGAMGSGTYYSYSGGGGGGGAKQAGRNGMAGLGYYPSWNGAGGLGGAGSTEDDLDPLVGGAGGGAGGNGGSADPYWTSWAKSGSAGGGGGGAINVQVARLINIGIAGSIVARGGAGGDMALGSYGPGGPGGGAGGGSVLARSGLGFNIVNVSTAFDVNGGAGGRGNTSTYTNYHGGDGGAGHIRLEDPNGGMFVPGGSQGVFDPVGGGVASFVYSQFIDLGVEGPRILEFISDNIATDPTSNDGIFVEIQMTRESPDVFGKPDTTAVTPTQDSSDTTITSQWLPLKVDDRTGTPGGAFVIPGYDPGAQGIEHVFSVASLNNKGYRFVRFRITFQLDAAHKREDAIPSVDFIEMLFQFNF